MPFDMYGDVILTGDLPEHGVRAGDIGTLVERPRRHLCSSFWTMATAR
jgi:hypothetical protein